MEREITGRKRSRIKLSVGQYKLLCLQVMERDGWKCQTPGCKQRQNLHVHHIIFRSSGGGDVSSNLLTLCNNCHEAVHNRYIIIKGLTNTATGGIILDADKKQYEIEIINGYVPGKKLK